MKKRFLLTVSAIMLLMTACGSSTNAVTETPSGKTSETASASPFSRRI